MWTQDELDQVGDAEELQVSSRREDGSLRPFVTIWVARVGDELFVRSAHGPDNPWYVRALKSSKGRIRAGGVERDVEFDHLDAQSDAALISAVDDAYSQKYRDQGPALVASVSGEPLHELTIRLLAT